MNEMGYWPDKGYVMHGDVSDTVAWLRDMHITPALSVADPPYGKILKAKWDIANPEEWRRVMVGLHAFWPQLTAYWWGGIGKPGARPFYEFILNVEATTPWRMRDLVTWSKKRAYGKSGDYLFTREELAIFTKDGGPYKTFHIPLLDVKRGYAGFNARYPAKSEFKRRTNVWHETELLRGKLHDAHKAPVVCRIPIETHTNKGDVVLDLYAGSGETSVQALLLGRHFVAVESDRETAGKICDRIEQTLKTQKAA